MAKINTNSNVYTIIYATVIVVIVALLLAVVSFGLKERQNDNVELAKKKQVLSSLNLDVKTLNVDEYYAEHIDTMQVADNLIILKASLEGETKYILPMNGAGLWGAIRGYLALNDDKNTIFGTYFDHDSETPGLGGEIATRGFQTRFNNKHILRPIGYLIEIVKGEPEEEQVQAISGATITSKGVELMINNTLEQYKPFLTNEIVNVEEASEASEATNDNNETTEEVKL